MLMYGAQKWKLLRYKNIQTAVKTTSAIDHFIVISEKVQETERRRSV